MHYRATRWGEGNLFEGSTYMGSQYFGPALVADAHSLSRCGLISLLGSSFSITDFEEATHFSQVLAILDRNPGVRFASIDMGLPGLLGAEGLRELRLKHPSLILVTISEGRERARVLDVLAAGANGYIPRNMAPDEMTAAFRTILSGQIYVPPTVTDVVEAPPTLRRGRLDQALTTRQREVLQQLMTGQSNREISVALGIAENTVKVHLAAAFRLLGVRNRKGAAAALSDSLYSADPGPSRTRLAAGRSRPEYEDSFAKAAGYGMN